MAELKTIKKINAATLLETMVALTIIVIVFGIGLSVLNNVMRSEKMYLHFKADVLIEKYFYDVTDTTGQNKFMDNGFRVERSFHPYPKDPALTILEVKVLSANNKLIEKQKQIVFMNDLTDR